MLHEGIEIRSAHSRISLVENIIETCCVHMAARTFRAKKNESLFALNFNVYINLGTRKRARAGNK